MRLTREGLKNREAWEAAGISLPSYDIAAAAEKAVKAPRWIHFGIGNIFRIFIGGIADELLEKGLLDRGLTCVETYDTEIVDRIYTPYDNLALSVILEGDGTRQMRVLGSLAETVKAENMARIREIFSSRELQLVSFTITEKGYALTGPDGTLLPNVLSDPEKSPETPASAMTVLTAGLLARFKAGRLPVALVSMDNCSQNGRLLKRSVCRVAEEWVSLGFAPEAFLHYLQDEDKVAFDCTMIDKITPRPGTAIAEDLEKAGIEQMEPLITAKKTYIAPFANGEGPQYLVIEDRFPNGRPALEAGKGVYLGDFETVNKAERMKVTALLNPVHTAVGPLGVVLGEARFADLLENIPLMERMARKVAFDEGMPAAQDPGLISPQAFAEELFSERFPNRYLGDTNLRLCTDASQGLAVRFGETIKTYVRQKGSAAELTAIPLGIAGWLRYMLGVDDQGKAYELAPDPLNEDISEALSEVRFGKPESAKACLKGILSRESLFGVNLYRAGLGEKIEEMFSQMTAGPGAALKTVEQWIG